MKTPLYIFIHHTAVSYEKNPDQWHATNDYHKKKWNVKSSLGFYGGYNYEISKDGKIKQFRLDGELTVAQYQKSMNDGRAISICLDMNGDIETPTQAQKDAVAKLLREKMAKYNIPKEHVFCHRYVAPKTCPGKLLPDNIYSYFISMPKESQANDKSQLSSWAEKSWQWAKDHQIITTTQPKEPITAEILIEILYKYHKNII